MIERAKILTYKILRYSERYTQTDMVYFASGGFWLLLGQFISTISAFLLLIAFANFLPKEVFGTYQYILATTETKMLYRVDQYLYNYDTSQWMYSKKIDRKANPDQDYENVKNACFNKFPGRFTLLKKSSRDAAEALNAVLDFVFIDANHSYEHVLADLKLWVPKVKSGGLIMGHDWWSKFPGVIIAVTEYATSTGLFSMPPKPSPCSKLPQNTKYGPAPAQDPVVMKSWPGGHVWWALKK